MKSDEFDLRPNPIIRDKNAERFYEQINGGKVEKQQEEFLEKCVKLLKETKQQENQGGFFLNGAKKR